MEKITMTHSLTPSEHKRREWTSTVVKLCKPQPGNERKVNDNKVEKKEATNAKPFSNFQKLRSPSGNGAKGTTKHMDQITDVYYGKSESRDPFGDRLHEIKCFVPVSITTKDFQSFGKTEAKLVDIYRRSSNGSGRRVRFQSDYDTVSDATSISLDSTISTVSSLKSKRSTAPLSKRVVDISNHRCLRSKISPDSKSLEQFWTPFDLDNVRQVAKKKVQKFQAKHPATVRQVDRLFGELCSINNKQDDRDAFEEDEEQEEMLRAFLEDWAAFGLRGLEEEVTARKMFREDRSMATGSVLTYQERLKAQERNQRMFSLYAPTAQEYLAAFEHRAELLRARSESTSHRARMFAMYMAQGDALFVASEDQHVF